MTLRHLIALPLIALAAPALANSAAEAPLPPEEAAIKAHIAFLASDELKGREAGTPEYDIAAQYVAAQMIAAGLTPAGADGGFFQPVPLVSYQAGGPGAVSLRRGAAPVPMAFGKDFIAYANPQVPESSVAAPVVFAAYGVVDPETKRDDYKGLDVKGKIVAVLHGAPKGLSSEVGAHLGSRDQKVTLAEAHGAKGVIILESTARHAGFPFERSVPYALMTTMTWAGPDGKARFAGAGAPPLAYLSQAGAEKLFAGSKLDWAAVLAADAAGAKVPTGDLGVSAEVRQKTKVKTTASANIVGLLPGSDPALKGQYVVLSAHLDHIGVDEGAAGDKIHNGALDNAAGIASMIEVARRFQASGKAPRRSVLFLAVTAEEKGLIGSEYFAHHPSMGKGALVANVNLDMPILTYDFQDMVALGGERSSIGPVVHKVLASEGLKLVPDPAPEENSFVRSDHYSFVQAGIPAVSLDIGPGGPGKAATELFLQQHYHQVSDDLSQPIDWGAARKFVRINYGIARALADADARPRWNKGDFFGTLFGGYGAK